MRDSSVSSDCEGSPPRRLGAAPQTLPMLSTALPSSSCNQLLFKILPAFLQLFGEGRGGVAMVVWGIIKSQINMWRKSADQIKRCFFYIIPKYVNGANAPL